MRMLSASSDRVNGQALTLIPRPESLTEPTGDATRTQTVGRRVFFYCLFVFFTYVQCDSFRLLRIGAKKEKNDFPGRFRGVAFDSGS